LVFLVEVFLCCGHGLLLWLQRRPYQALAWLAKGAPAMPKVICAVHDYCKTGHPR
jgi:hypothetical protein